MNPAKRRLVLAVTLAEHGGVQEFLLQFADWLKSRGHEVILVAGEGEWLFEACKTRGITTHKIQHLRRAIHPWHDFLALIEMHNVLRKIKPDAIHLNSSKMGIIGALAARFTSVPRTVYRIGGWVFLEPLSPSMRWLYRVLERISASWKDVIICVHPGDTELARSLSIRPRQQLLTIPNGIDLGSFEEHLLSREEARRNLGLPADGFIFGTIANFFPAKALPDYLHACSEVHRAHPDIYFALIGDGRERTLIQQKRQTLDLENAVFLPGLVPQASRYLRAFDAFVLPSVKEGMSWALLEAMAAELPCIATDVGANRWLLAEEAGWIVSPQHSERLATAMKEVIEDQEEAKARARQAKKRVSQDFPLEKTLQDNENTLIN